jgi:hypothetical protein
VLCCVALPIVKGNLGPVGQPLTRRSQRQEALSTRHSLPNKGEQPTAYSVRSSVAPASSGGWRSAVSHSQRSPYVFVPYTLVGLVLATVAGIDAAFQLESRSAELTLLAAECQSTIWQIDSAWQQTAGTIYGEEQIAAARGLNCMEGTSCYAKHCCGLRRC